ncbi:uncharacterized protein LOC117482645 [Trematomus bernacchii]|uniref:uncharacterized protein LOC117482645 n=1 Tax=Trematomus bernacchii TaxID=40690 RepID=UPI00146A6BA4|nr:uncharacterized protein LOC117482645 [Trematomus bernacchii]
MKTRNVSPAVIRFDLTMAVTVVKHRRAVNISISSDCELDIYHSYSVHCEPEGFFIQPESKTFDSRFGPNYYPAFLVSLTTSTERVVLKVKDQGGNVVWYCRVSLEDPRKELSQRNVQESRVSAESRDPAESSVSAESRVPAESSVPADQRLFSVRTEFIQRVTPTLLIDLLDKLFESGVITESEMTSARTKPQNGGAREVVDAVRNKGAEASRVLINALRELDPYLYRKLNLS